MAETAPIGVVHTGFATEGHALFEDGLIAFRNPGRFMVFDSNAVPGSVFEELLEPCFADLIQAFLIDFFGDRAFFQVLRCGVVGREHSVEQPLGIIGWFPDGERALALHAVAAHLCPRN